jgi:hypothetical protein
MVMQAWGAYGPVWTVVHQQLGARPDLGNGALEVTPQVPPGQPSIAGKNIRLGNGSVDVSATDTTTVVNAHLKGIALTIGHTLSAGATVKSVKLDGADAPYTIRDTNRGREVLVKAQTGREETLTVSTT